nr:unnamed protein product [Digitaria exilis]
MAAGTKRPRRRTGSMVCGVPSQLSRHPGYGIGEAVRSASFSVGGHHWCIKYYPAGYAKDCEGYVSIFLHLLSTNAEATMLHDFRLVHQATGVSKQLNSCLIVFADVEWPSWGFRKFMKKTDLEARGYLKDDFLQSSGEG